MGKRKKSSRKPTGPKKREPLATQFKCPFCAHENSVSVQLDKKNSVFTVSCRQCGQNYQGESGMGSLMQPVDAYYQWIDACEDLAKQEAADNPNVDAPPSTHRSAARPAANARAGLAPGEKYTDEDAGFIDDDDVDAEADEIPNRSSTSAKRKHKRADSPGDKPLRKMRKVDRELWLQMNEDEGSDE